MFPAPLVGAVVLSLEYTGPITDTLCGVYRSKYVNAAGQSCFAIVTQFEVWWWMRVRLCSCLQATDARRALPCWDEPAIKAKYVPCHVAMMSFVQVFSHAGGAAASVGAVQHGGS